MNILTHTDANEQQISTAIDSFLKTFLVSRLLRRCNAFKERGTSALQIFRYLMNNVFNSRSMYMQIRTGSYREDFCKNTYYRFLGRAKTNWLRFTTMLSAEVVNSFMRDLTNDDRKDVFIIDDTLYQRTGYKHTDMVAKVFDHVDMKFRKGFRLLTLGWSDGNSFVPVNFSLLSSHNEDNQIGVMDRGDGRTLAGRRRRMATRKATDVMLELLETAVKAGHAAKYVLFDTWFATPHQIISIRNMGLDSIAMVKHSSRIKYGFNGSRLDIKEIYSRCKKRRGRSRYLLSVEVTVGKEGPDEHPIPARIVYVRNRTNRKDWIALLCTDMALDENEIIRVYGKRWDIEVFFKTCKSYLKLRKECQSTSYDALTAHVAVVFSRYMIMSVCQRRDEDHRALGELFYIMLTELEDITFTRSMMVLVEAMFQSVKSVFQITEDQLEVFAADFFGRLPKYMQDSLGFAAVSDCCK